MMLKHVITARCVAGKNRVKSGTCKQDLKGQFPLFRVNGLYTPERANNTIDVSIYRLGYIHR